MRNREYHFQKEALDRVVFEGRQMVIVSQINIVTVKGSTGGNFEGRLAGYILTG